MNAIYPGSFDPVTNGHINIARRSAAVMGHLIVAVLDNPHKTPMFSVNERLSLLQEVFNRDSNIEVEAFSGLLADFARQKGIRAIVRGVRGPEDLANEQPYAVWNRHLGTVETLYLSAEPNFAHISGSIVKEVASLLYSSGADDKVIAQMVPPAVRAALREKLK